MMYKTHKAGAVLGLLVAFDYMETGGLLIPSMNNLLQLAIMYPAASWGGTAPDLDHATSNIKEQTPFNMLVHRFLHLFKPRHRSWQTHSIIYTGGICAFLIWVSMIYGEHFGSLEWKYIRLVLVGASVGVASHILLDALTVSGVYLGSKTKFRLVPKWKMFSGGGVWEAGVYSAILFGIFVSISERVLAIDFSIETIGYLFILISVVYIGFVTIADIVKNKE